MRRLLLIAMLLGCDAPASAPVAEPASEAPRESPPDVAPEPVPAPITIDTSELPWLSAEGTGCGVELALQTRALDDDIASIAIVMAPSSVEHDESVALGCDDGRVVREIGRAAIDAVASARIAPDVRIPMTLGESDVGCDRRHALRVCARDRLGALHGDSEALGRAVSSGHDEWIGAVVSTPSGTLPWWDIERRTVLLGWDRAQHTATETTVRGVLPDYGAGPQVFLRLSDGTSAALPRTRLVWLAELDLDRPAGELAVGDVVWTDRLVSARVVSRADGGPSHALPIDVEGDAYFEDGVLVRDARVTPPTVLPIVATDDDAVVLRARRPSSDCMLETRLDVRAWPEGAASIALVVSPQVGSRGARTTIECAAASVRAEVPRAVFDALHADRALAATGLVSIDVQLSGEGIACSTDYALLACARDATGALSAPPGARARHARSGATCFAAGTPIATPNGMVAIEALTRETSVFARDVETGVDHVVAITARRAHQGRPIASLVLSSGVVLRVTDEHPMWDPERRAFRLAGELGPGDALLALDGTIVRVLRRDDRRERATVYDLSVEGPHTYFAGGVLAHNY